MAQHGDRRLAEEFDLALTRAGGASGAGTSSAPASAAQTATLVAVAHRVGQTSAALPGMDDAFKAQLRERLVRLAPELTGGPARAQVPSQRGGKHAGPRRPASTRPAAPAHVGLSAAWRRRLLAAGVGVAVATGSVGGIAIASAGAVPGDPLYSAKKMFENIQLSLSGSPTDRGGQYLKLADIRLGEIDALLARHDADVPGSPTAAYLAQALDDLQSMIGDGGGLLVAQVREHGDEQAVRVLSDFLLTERQRVKDLAWQLPLQLQGQPPRVVALMDDLYRQLQQAEATMPAPGAAPAASPGTTPGGGGGVGTVGGHGTEGGSASGTHQSASGGASPSQTPDAGASSTNGPSAGASPSGSAIPTIKITLPLPILPSTGLNVPPLLPGVLPGIDLGLGGGGDASPTPTD